MYPDENLCVHSKPRIVEFLVFDKKIRKKNEAKERAKSTMMPPLPTRADIF